MRNLLNKVSGVALALAVTLGAGQVQAAGGATQEGFVWTWSTNQILDPGFEKVIWVQPAGKNKINVTYVLKNLIGGTDYQLGFNIYTVDPIAAGGLAFGQLSAHGASQPAFGAIYLPGTVTADGDGDASFHINIKNIDLDVWCDGDYFVVFWLDTPPGSLSPDASTDTHMSFPPNDPGEILATFPDCP